MKRNPLDGFVVERDAISHVGAHLSRPECVLSPRDGSLWACDARGGVAGLPFGKAPFLIAPGSANLPLASLPASATGASLPNGVAIDATGAFLIANIGTGRLERLERDGRFEVLAEQIDGQPIGKINFVLRDSRGRTWITVSTRREQWIDAIARDVADGYIALFDGVRWRIVADGFAFTNEARLDADESWLYVAETCGPRVTRLRVADDGSLSERQTFGPARHDAFIDGIAFDSHGNLWGTHVHRDRLFAITPEGEYRVLFDDGHDLAAHARTMHAFDSGQTIDPALLQACEGRVAPGLTSIAFGGADMRTVYLGSLRGTRIASFRSPVAGLPLQNG